MNKNIQNNNICRKQSLKYANRQDTLYDTANNLMLYGINSNMHVTGTSDGTCNQINPLIPSKQYKCGAGSAGANPCTGDNSKYLENFESDTNAINITNTVVSLILCLLIIFLLYISINKIDL